MPRIRATGRFAELPHFVAFWHFAERLRTEYPGRVGASVFATLMNTRKKILLGQLSGKELRQLERESAHNLRAFWKKRMEWDRQKAIALHKRRRLH